MGNAHRKLGKRRLRDSQEEITNDFRNHYPNKLPQKEQNLPYPTDQNRLHQELESFNKKQYVQQDPLSYNRQQSWEQGLQQRNSPNLHQFQTITHQEHQQTPSQEQLQHESHQQQQPYPNQPEPQQNSSSEVESNVNPESIEGEVVVALHDFSARNNTEVSFNQGDKLLTIRVENLDYLYARHLGTNYEGYIPRNFVTQEWFFEETSRKDAENYLLKVRNEDRSFLVRKAASSSPIHKYSLSIKTTSEKATGFGVQHYRINQKDGLLYCEKGINFQNFSQFLAYYKEKEGKPNLLNLRAPCQRIFQRYDVDTNTKNNWELDRSDINLVQRIGAGNFGEVWLGEMQRGTLQVAVKTLKKNSMTVDEFMAEAAIMKKMQHKYILPLWGVCSKEEPIFIVTQYMNLGSLLDVLRANKHIDNLKKRINVSYQVASGMTYLEDQGFIHRDLAARNVLVNSDLDSKICDFGLARICEDEYSPENPKKFPVKWSAPEVLDFQKYTIKSDVWSFGIVLVEIFTHGVVPYPGMNNQEVIERIKKGYRMKKPNDCPEDLFSEIVEKCWEIEAENRPTFVFMESYLDSYDPSTDVKYH